MTIYLKFAGKQEFEAAFEPYIQEGKIPSYIGPAAVDVVGVIYKPTGSTLVTEDGLSYPELEPIDGWHVNLSGATRPEGLQAFAIEAPATPARVFAGA